MFVASAMVENPSTSEALAGLNAQFASDQTASIVFAFYGCCHDADAISAFVAERFPGAQLIGGSSCGGVLDASGARSATSLGLMVIDDPDGEYGAAAAPLGDDPAKAAEAAVVEALARADCTGELPELVWIYQAPGREEAAIEGLRRVVGDRCPVVGGSSADNDVSGQWTQLSQDGGLSDGIVVAVLFPSTPLGFAFQGGYEPNGFAGCVTRVDSGRVTQVEGTNGSDGVAKGRTIVEIDGRPAAQVYDDWCDHAFSEKISAGGNILAESNLTPLSVLAGCEDGIDQYLLIHPEAIRADGAMTTFAEIAEGTEIHCMRGESDQLITRAGRVARQAASRLGTSKPAGALLIFCGGCRMAVGDRIDDLAAVVTGQLAAGAAIDPTAEATADTAPAIPMLTCFTFGEQGPMIGRNSHGNLMISALVFGS